MNTLSIDTGYSLNRPVVISGMVISILILMLLSTEYGWRQSALLSVGLAAGIILYHAAFGFTSAWRVFFTHRLGAGLRAQMIMLAITVLVFLPLINLGEFNGQALRGSVAPLSLSIIFGAFMFGIGMQLGGGCASGTLYTVGGGSSRMIFTLIAFIAGSVLGAWHWQLWQQVPSLPAVSLLQSFGLLPAIVISFLIFGVIWFGTRKLESQRYGELQEPKTISDNRSWFFGPWPLIAGAIGLAMVQLATLLLAGRPWGVTSGFALWGSKLVALTGVNVSSWGYFQRPAAAAALESSVFTDITTVMNIGIILGALIAAGLAGKFAPNFKIGLKPLLAAIIGGLLLGYGARIAYGCNIGAFFSGIGSSSLHGWLWFVAAFAGNFLGVRLRPMFELEN